MKTKRICQLSQTLRDLSTKSYKENRCACYTTVTTYGFSQLAFYLQTEAQCHSIGGYQCTICVKLISLGVAWGVQGKRHMHEIAILGGGPTGLLLARSLLHRHVPLNVTIYVREPNAESRDQGGSLDLHEDYGQ